MGGVRGDDQRVQTVPTQHVDVLRLAVRGVGGGAQHRLQTAVRELVLQVRGERGEERVLDGGHDDADDVSLAVVEIARELVGHIVELAHGLLDLLAHIA